MKKIINFRPLLYFFMFFAAGIFCGFVRLKFGEQAAVFIFSAIPLLSLIYIAVSFLPLNRSNLSQYKKYRYFIVLLLAIFFAGYMLFNFSINSFKRYEINDGKTASVNGEITECYYTANGGYVLLENADVTAEDGYAYKGRVFVYISGGDRLPDSGYMSFTGKININRIFSGGKINTYYMRNGIHYSFFIDGEDYTLSQSRPSVFLSVKRYVKNLIYSYMRKDNADICYALITGESLLMEDGITEAFRNTGIAHIFSVSGLHMGVLSAAIIYLLNKLKIKNIFQIFIIAVFMFFYAGVVGFTPSVIRAALMTIILLISKAAGQKYDSLSSLSLAAIIILIISPLMLFDIGFILSFMSVLGIILFYRPLQHITRFLPYKLSSLFSVSVSAQIFIIPLTAAFFGYIPVISVFLNIVIIPLISIAYICLLVVCVLGFIPYVGYAFFVPQGLAEFVKTMVGLAYRSGISNVHSKGLGFGIIPYYLLLFTLSGLVFLNVKTKTILSAVLCAVIVFCAISYNTYNFDKFTFSSVNARNIKASVITCGGKTYYIDYGSTTSDTSGIRKYLIENGITVIEAAFFTDYNTAVLYTEEFKGFNVKKYIMPYDIKYLRLLAEHEAEGRIKYLLSEECYTYESISFKAYYFNGRYYGGMAYAGGYEFLYISDCGENSLDYIKANFSGNPVAVFADSAFLNIKDFYKKSAIITDSYIDSEHSNIYSSGLCGSLIFSIKNGRIVKKYSY